MKTPVHLLVVLAFAAGALRAYAQPFNSGSTGALGDLVVEKTKTLDLPPDGIFHCKKVTIAPGAILTFRRNALNTPAIILAQDDVLIQGMIDISGSVGTGTAGGAGGPGGFDGGRPGFGDTPPGSGFGPGGGHGGLRGNEVATAGAGGFNGNAGGASTNFGLAYGNSLLIPLIGGSGGGGTAYYGDAQSGFGGGGGGGALLLASSTRVEFSPKDVSYSIFANGGPGNNGQNGGSGGAVRVVAPVITGPAIIYVQGRESSAHGRVRLDAIDVSGLQRQIQPAFTLSIGSVMLARLNPEPRLDLVEVAGTAIAEDTAGLVQITLPTGSNPSRTVTVQARNFGTKIPVEVVLTPDSGLPVVAQVEIDNTTVNPAKLAVPVTFPVNVGVTVNAWARGKP